MTGALVIDKPSGWTSHDVVAKLRGIAGTRRIGHLGTLDPLATGVLPILLNKATRLAQYFGRNDKKYEGVIRFGYSTDSYDADGEPTSPITDPILSREQVLDALDGFRGPILQTPPAISAKKIAGKPAYKLARQNKPVELKPVEVTVFDLEVVHVEGCDVRVRVHCGPGTYVRSIAHDAGQRLGCGAFLKELRRVASGAFAIEQAHTLEDLAKLAAEGKLTDALIPAAELLPEFPVELVDDITEGQIRNGRTFRVSPFRNPSGSRFVKAVNREGELVALGEAHLPGIYQPVVVL